jgi:hypothetical protein
MNLVPYVLVYEFKNSETKDIQFCYSGFVKSKKRDGAYTLSEQNRQFTYFSGISGECNLHATIYISLEFAQKDAKRIEHIHNEHVPDNQVHIFVRTLDSVLQDMKKFYKE